MRLCDGRGRKYCRTERVYSTSRRRPTGGRARTPQLRSWETEGRVFRHTAVAVRLALRRPMPKESSSSSDRLVSAHPRCQARQTSDAELERQPVRRSEERQPRSFRRAVLHGLSTTRHVENGVRSAHAGSLKHSVHSRQSKHEATLAGVAGPGGPPSHGPAEHACSDQRAKIRGMRRMTSGTHACNGPAGAAESANTPRAIRSGPVRDHEKRLHNRVPARLSEILRALGKGTRRLLRPVAGMVESTSWGRNCAGEATGVERPVVVPTGVRMRASSYGRAHCVQGSEGPDIDCCREYGTPNKTSGYIMPGEMQ